MTGRKRAAALAVAVSLGACSSDASDAGDAPAPAGAPVRTVERAAEGYSLAIPASWTDAIVDPSALDPLIARHRDSNPHLARLLDLRRVGQPGSYLGVDETTPGADVNVLATAEGPAVPADQRGRVRDALLEPANTADIDAKLGMNAARDQEREPVDLPIGPAVRATYRLRVQTGTDSTRVYRIQYYLPAGTRVYVISCSTTDLAVHEAPCDRIAHSVRAIHRSGVPERHMSALRNASTE